MEGIMSALTDPRVLFAGERTLLAWNRSSLALIAFGFLIERSGLLLSVVSPSPQNIGNSPLIFGVGLGFIALGLFAAVYSSRQYLVFIKTLDVAEFPRGYATHGGLILNGTVVILGVVLAAALYSSRM
jgi:putative membrane protein